MYAYVCVQVLCVRVFAHKYKSDIWPLELKLQVVSSHQIWVLETKLWPYLEDQRGILIIDLLHLYPLYYFTLDKNSHWA